jgi:hypothetical protein
MEMGHFYIYFTGYFIQFLTKNTYYTLLFTFPQHGFSLPVVVYFQPGVFHGQVWAQVKAVVSIFTAIICWTVEEIL